MKLTLTTSTGVEIVVWREGEMFYARRAGAPSEPQICLGVDLFEVLAELAGLDLDRTSEAAEAVQLADYAQGRLLEREHGARQAESSLQERDQRRSS